MPVIFSTPTTSTKRPSFAARVLRPWRMAAEPVAQAFSTRVAGLKRKASEVCRTREAGKPWGEKVSP